MKISLVLYISYPIELQVRCRVLKKLFPFMLVALSATILGCNSTKGNQIKVDGEVFTRNEDGSISVSKEQLNFLKGVSTVVVIDNVLPSGGVAVTEGELHLMSKDDQLLRETINMEVTDTEVYTFLVKQGSLKENLNRLSKKYSTEHDPLSLEYGDVDYYVAESKIIRAMSLDELVAETLSSFPVFAEISGFAFYLKKGSLKENLVRLSEKYSSKADPISIEYTGGDFYVPKSELIKADSLEQLVAVILAPYPVFSTID